MNTIKMLTVIAKLVLAANGVDAYADSETVSVTKACENTQEECAWIQVNYAGKNAGYVSAHAE